MRLLQSVRNLGPGIIMAATAIGTSHLILSVREHLKPATQEHLKPCHFGKRRQGILCSERSIGKPWETT